jgi:hypothetical protein
MLMEWRLMTKTESSIFPLKLVLRYDFMFVLCLQAVKWESLLPRMRSLTFS